MRSETRRLRRLNRTLWIAAAIPVAIVGLALLARGLLALAGAECVPPNTPNSLDGDPDCNSLGAISDTIGSLTMLWAVVTVPPAIVAALGAVFVALIPRR